MLTSSASIVLGLAFVLTGGINVWLVLEAWSGIKNARMLALHRIGGYFFIALFCVMSYFMIARLRNSGADNSAGVTIHLALAMILSPLLFIKVLIARYYKNQHGLLMPIGLTIFVLAFVLVASAAGPYLAHVSRVEEVSIDQAQPVSIDLNQAADLMQRRCSKCHNLDRVVGARKDAQGWRSTVDRMRALPAAGISEAEAQTIFSYLVSQNQPAARMQVARALVDQRCGRCHSLDRVYKTVQTPAEWRETVTRMVGYAAGSTGALQPGEDQQIIDFLASTQTAEAASRRKSVADAAAIAGRSLIERKAIPVPTAPSPPSRYDGKTVGFISFVCLAAVSLVIRRPRARIAPPAKPAPAPPPAAAPFLLHLVRITPQTPDSKTLRFAVSGERKIESRPGQFLTFSFLFNGRKETRCYSICSSAAAGYVEITPKRVPGGCVSVFLNDRAFIGMTVEAAGPFGQFYLDPAEDRNIVLIAAGSGITPMMAMLRYIDDLSIDTDATLLYCVRTRQDILFQRDLDGLQERSPGIRCQIVLSQPDPEWTGARGRIRRELVSEAVPNIEDRTFFLCGPPPFMDATRAILMELGVRAQQVRQETFGGSDPRTKPPQPRSSEQTVSVEFARSGKTAAAMEGQTLLEAAAAAGVEIPSACRQGQCGTCKTRLLDGRVHMTAESGLDPESRARGFVLTCVGHPDGNVRIDA